MPSGFYLAAISGAVISFITGCIWYTSFFGKLWQKEMNFSDTRVKEIFVPKRILVAFVSEWIASFCTVGLLFNLQIGLLYKVIMIATVIAFQGVKLSIFDGKTFKTILINEGYRIVSIVIIATTFTIFM